eukprot:m.167146 g.167146  ORF g.167146 m.167146 type:complete len:979 (+) comp31454_c0_seq3:101-3037(+)
MHMVMSNMFATFLVASSIVAAATAKWVVPTKADVSGFSSLPGQRTSVNPSINDPPSLEPFIKSLLGKMTVKEKARQLLIEGGDNLAIKNGVLNEAGLNTWLKDLGAGVLDSMGRNVDPQLYNEIQKAVIASSKHGIGTIFADECQHGVQGDHHTIFPSPYTVAATFDKNLLRSIGGVIGTEARAGGTTQCWSPVCGLAREPRWGRSEEEMSEDPFLAGELASAMVQGMVQGGNLTNPQSVSPLLKHFAAYSIPESGRNAAPAHIGRREMLETFLPVFEKAVRAGAQGAMSSYNEVDGVPTTSDYWLLTEQLRDTFGFDGYVASDFGAIQGLGPDNHAVAANDSDCIRQFLEAGGSVNGHDMGDNYETLIVGLVTSNVMSLATLDKAVANVLRVKARLGLIENGPMSDTLTTNLELIRTNLGANQQHVELAERAALESVVLLKNDQNILPLKQDIAKLLILGPNADEVRTGDYSAAGWAGGAPNGGGNINNNNSVTVIEGLKKMLPNTNVTYVVGTGINGDDDFFTVVQRHSFTVATEFTPTAPTNHFEFGYDGHAALPQVISGSQGLKGTYFDNENLTGSPMYTRLDYAVNFHWFALGPSLSESATFSVSWEGMITPDTTTSNATFLLELCHGHSCSGQSNLGGRVYIDGILVFDAWINGTNVSPVPVALKQGKSVSIKVEYWQLNSINNPAVALQWSLNPNLATATTEILTGKPDAIVMVMGGANNDGVSTTEGEGVDRASLSLPGMQLSFIQSVRETALTTNTPVIVVLIDGKPTAEPFLKTTMPVVVAAFQGGQASGSAIAQVITGKYNPSGKLPVSFPASADVLPVYYNHKPSSSRGGWIDFADGVLWPFGHGLSYTTFEYSNLTVADKVVGVAGTVTVHVTVKNNGTVAGEEVAQLYVRQHCATVTTPVKSLKGFERLHLAPQQSMVVSFTIDVATELRLLDRNFKWGVQASDFTIMVGGTSKATLSTTFTIA